MTHSTHRLSIDRIKQAAKIIDPVFLNSPQFVCEPLSEKLGKRLVLKIETLNPIRSFKGRGADFLVSQVKDGDRLICASAGNFGQAMAYACRKRGLNLTVYASKHANPLKVERMRSLEANVILDGEDFDAAKHEAKRAALEQNYRFIEDGRDIETVEGAGTMGLEWLNFPEPLDSLLIPLGNGAMLNGISRVMKAYSPKTRIVAIQAAGAPAMIESWRAGRIVIHDRIHTIADGIGVRVPVPEALEDMHGFVDNAILVSEEMIVKAMRLLYYDAGIVVEPSGAVGVAAILEQPEAFDEQSVGTIVCGGNLTMEQMQTWLH
jgi:threonine dehydratase